MILSSDTADTSPGDAPADAAIETRALRRIAWRLIPFMFLLYLAAYIDRANVAIAALQMKADLAFSDTVYGVGAGIFFLGYFLFEVPSNLLLERFGARRWIARIAFTWGLIATGMAFVQTATWFYVLRFLLGVAEAGFFPGMIFYLTYWFPAATRARAIAWFMTAGAASLAIGGPLGGALLKLDGLHGFHGWQWLFVIEGVPSVILGVLTLFVLTDRPEVARWLPEDERRWLLVRLSRERAALGSRAHLTLGQAFRFPQVWILAGIYLANGIGGYGISLWLPQIIKAWGDLSDAANAALSGLPYLCGAIPGLLLIGRRSDRVGERRNHVIVMALVAAAGLVLSAFLRHPVAGLAAISLALFGIWGALSPFWAMSSALLSGTAAAGAIALINSHGALGGFVGPVLVGRLREATGSNTAAMLALASLFLAAALLTSRLPQRRAAGADAPPGARQQEKRLDSRRPA